MLNTLILSMQGDTAQLFQGLIESLIGFIIVIVGIGFLIGILSLVSFVIMKIANKKPKTKKKVAPEVKKDAPLPEKKAEPEKEEIPDEVKAAIIAAIMAYDTAEKPKAEFTVKRIKRI